MPDADPVRAETIERLQTIIRFDTTNPPGNELALALYLETALKREGIETSILVPEKNRAQLIGRIRGNGNERPLILLAHMDVVTAQRSSWTHDPFGGEVSEGYLYGRGAIDDKGMLAANLMATLLLKRELDR